MKVKHRQIILLSTYVLSFVLLIGIFFFLLKQVKEIKNELESKRELIFRYKQKEKYLPSLQKKYEILNQEYNLLLKRIFSSKDESLAYAEFSELVLSLASKYKLEGIIINKRPSQTYGQFKKIRLYLRGKHQDLKNILSFLKDLEYNTKKLIAIEYILLRKEKRLKSEIFLIELILAALWKAP